MLERLQILVRPIIHARRAVIAGGALMVLAACGQPGALYLPTEPAAAGRATLPEILLPGQRTRSEPTTTVPTQPTSPPAQQGTNASTPPR